MSVKDNLIAARALIDTPEKWGKWDGPNANPDCPCVLDAVRIASGYPGFSYSTMPEYPALLSALPDGTWKDKQFVGGYNDHPETTHADIMALFDRAIALSEASA